MELMNALAKFDDASAQGRAAAPGSLRGGGAAAQPDHAAHLRTRSGRLLGHAEALLEDLAFPVADPAALVRDAVTLAVQVNGKLRGTIEVAVNRQRETIEALALAEPNVQKFMEGVTVRKVIVVPGKIVNIVAG